MEEVNENVKQFRNRYAQQLECDDPDLFFLILEKIKELKEGKTDKNI